MNVPEFIGTEPFFNSFFTDEINLRSIELIEHIQRIPVKRKLSEILEVLVEGQEFKRQKINGIDRRIHERCCNF